MFMFYFKKTVKKLLAFPLWFAFIFLSLIAKPMFFLFRIMSVPGIIVSFTGMYLSFTDGTTYMVIFYAAIGVTSIIMLFAAPRIVHWIIKTKYYLKETALFPIVVRPKYKFIVDFNY